MRVGHINLAVSMNGTGEHFVRLVEALERQGVEQHVLVANHALAKRVSLYDRVSVGPLVRTPIMAYCLMPEVGVVHAHGRNAGQAGLLMTLTRSTPYVLTRRSQKSVGRNPVSRSIVNRAACIICPSEEAAACIRRDDFSVPLAVIADISHESVETNESDNRAAAEYLRIYRRAVDTWRISTAASQ